MWIYTFSEGYMKGSFLKPNKAIDRYQNNDFLSYPDLKYYKAWASLKSSMELISQRAKLQNAGLQ